MDCSSDDSEEFLNLSDTGDGSPKGNENCSSVTSKNMTLHGSGLKEPLLSIAKDLRRLVKEVAEEQVFFCAEDILLSKDIKVAVEDVGQLSIPLDKKSVEQIITLSSKAKFGMGEETLIDTNIRDTQAIPAEKLQVEIENPSFDELLCRLGTGLNIVNRGRLIPHLHNLLVYGPGQFFKKHTDSEKVDNMIATLVVILPSMYQGGELVIEHNNKKHMVLGSKHPDVIKCVAFYSDCAHEIKKVTEGYRVVLTYNIALQPPDVQVLVEVDPQLDAAVQKFFDEGETKLVVGLNHSYSVASLRWDLMKGEDCVVANTLLSVAKKQGRVPYLALGKFYEIYDVEDKYYDEEPDLIENEQDLKFWIDENNLQCESVKFHSTYINDSEFCFTKKTKDLCKPYKTKESGPTGNEGMTEELWYRRACLVLWSSKWVLVNGFKEELEKLHSLTNQKGMEKILLEKIEEIGDDFIQEEVWLEPSIADLLLDIITYLNNEDKATMVLSRLGADLLQEDRIDRLIKLERQFGGKVWKRVVKYWKHGGSGWYKVVSQGCAFIEKYITHAGNQFKSNVIDNILEKLVDNVSKQEHRISYVYKKIKEEYIDEMYKTIKLCSQLDNYHYVSILLNHVISVWPAVSQGELYCKLKDTLKECKMLLSLKDSAEKAIRLQLSQLQEPEDWSLDKEYYCDCKKCKQFKEFFKSKLMTKLVIDATKTLKEHIQEILCHYEKYDYEDYYGRYKITFKRNNRKFVITFEKLKKLQTDRQKLKDDLNKYLEEMLNVKPFVFVEVKVEKNEERVDEIMNPLETFVCVKKEELPEGELDLKFEVGSEPGDADSCDTPRKRVKK